MLQKLKQREEGFTIIEVLIVLAIAGLIMLIVFLAVPALERSSRNTSRKNDVSNILSAINTYTDNNGGALPASQTQLVAAISDTKLGYYTGGTNGHIYYATTPVTTPSSPSTAPSATKLTTEDVIVIPGYTCTSQTAVPQPGSARAIAIEWVVETTTSPGTLQCQSS